MATLRKKKRSWAVGRKARRNPVRLILDNWGIKISSALVTLLLFFYVQYTLKITRTLQVPVEPPSLPEELVFSGKVPPFISVEFSGYEAMANFDASEYRIIMENPNPEPGARVYRAVLNPDLPEGVSAVHIKELQLSVDQVLERELPVIPLLELTAADRKLGYISINPRTIVLRGPYEILANMDRVSTKLLQIEETEELLSRRVLVDELPDFVEFAPNQSFEIEITVNILHKEKQEYSIIEDLPIRCSNDLPGLRMQIIGESSVKLFLSPGISAPRRNQLQVQVFCPVFFETESKSIRPSFLIQDQPVFITGQQGFENVQVLDVEPSLLSMQFEVIGKNGVVQAVEKKVEKKEEKKEEAEQ